MSTNEKTLKTRIIHKHETEADWLKATGFTPLQGELIVYDIDDTHDYERFKIGDGETNVNDLPFSISTIPLNIIDEICGLVQVLEGDGANYYTLAPTALSFRSEAPLNELTEIQVDGEVLDSSNYILTEGSTIATLPISYLQTLSPGQHTVKIVSKSMAPAGSFDITQPELNEYGFYWNQPYVGYNNNTGQDIMFILKADGTFEGLLMGDGYDDSGVYTINDNEITLDDGGWQIYNLTIVASNSGKTFTATNGETFNLDESFVSDGEFMYILTGSSYKIRPVDKEKSSYGIIKTGIYGKETTKIDEYSFGGNANLTKIVIPKSINEIGEQAFNGCTSLNSIVFEGTMELWSQIDLGSDWNYEVPATHAQCSDGNVTL